MGRLYSSKEKIAQLTVLLTEGEQCLISYLETHLECVISPKNKFRAAIEKRYYERCTTSN